MLTSAYFSFIERYRIPPFLVQKLIGEISPYVEDDVENGIPLHLRLLAALNFYASGCYQRKVGTDAFAMMSQSVVSKCITEISRVITEKLAPKYIKFPERRADIVAVKNRFLDDYGLPGVLGLVDGTQIRVAGVPINKKSSYINRRGFPSINTQVIIDSDMRILSINARYPGSTHDTRIWHNSEIFTLLEENFNLHNQHDNIYRDSFLLGDLGYPLEPWLMIPFQGLEDDQVHEKAYNKKQRKIRNKIERFNACLKNRFRCILGERALRYGHDKAGNIIYACATLHNFLIENSFDIEYATPPFIELDNADENENIERDEDDEDDVNFDVYDEYLFRGEVIRNQIVANYF